MAVPGCNNMAALQVDRGDAAARAAGLARMASLCAEGFAMSCGNLGTYHYEGEVLPADLPAALGFFDRGCELGSGHACGWSGYMRDHGEGTEAADPAAAYPFFARACELGDPWGCSVQGQFLTEGLGGDRDWAGGMAALERACALGEDDGCHLLHRGLLFGMDNNGDVTPEGMRRAIAYFT